MRIVALALAFGLLAGVAVAQTTAPTAVSVELSEFRFNPKAIEFKPHTAYVLHLINTGGAGHNLVAPEFFKASTLAPSSVDKVQDGKIELKKGETVDIELTTGDAGAYPMHCSHPAHSMLGMKGTIEVR